MKGSLIKCTVNVIRIHGSPKSAFLLYFSKYVAIAAFIADRTFVPAKKPTSAIVTNHAAAFITFQNVTTAIV
jgi:hypothetical protein